MTLPPRLLLGDIAESVDYGVTASAAQQPVGPKFLRITDIQDGVVDWSQVPWCECPQREVGQSALRPGDIVFARTGATTGKSFFVRDCPDNAVFASYLIRVRLGKQADPGYVSHFFQSADYWSQITKSARGAAQPGVNATTLRSLEIPLPPLPNQRRIAAILDQAEALRTKRRAAIAKHDSLVQSLFIEMFGNPVTNTRGWKQVEMDSAVVGKYGIKAGPFGSSLKKEDYEDSGYRIYGQEQVIAGRFDIGNYFIGERKYQQLKSCAVTEGDLLVSLVGSFGKVLIVPAGIEPGIINPRLLKITPNQSLITPVFLAALLQHSTIQAELQRVAHGGTMGILNAGLLKRLEVILPPISLQHDFSKVLKELETMRSRQSTSMSMLSLLFASLQQRAFRAEL